MNEAPIVTIERARVARGRVEIARARLGALLMRVQELAYRCDGVAMREESRITADVAQRLEVLAECLEGAIEPFAVADAAAEQLEGVLP
jgi:hypothetical protein